MTTATISSATLANLNLAVVEYALGCEAEDNRKAEGNGYIVLGNGAHYPADEDYSFEAMAEEEAWRASYGLDEVEAEDEADWDSEYFQAHVDAVASKWATLSDEEKKDEAGQVSDMFKDLYGYRPSNGFFHRIGLV